MVNWSGGFSGAVGGGLGGSAIPGLGTVGGAILGGLGGLFGGDGQDDTTEEARQRLMAMSQGGYNPGQAGYSDQRGRQISYLDQLQALSNGQGPSLAKEMLRDAMQRSEASQASTAAGAVGRGVGAGAAYRGAAGNIGAMDMNAQRVGAMARAQEQLGALNMYGQHIAGTRDQDEGMNRFNTTQLNDAGSQNQLMRLQALQSAGNMTGGGGASLGDQIGAGGASLYGLVGGRNRNQVPAGNQMSPGRPWW
jgi:hypothetical protein